MIRNLRSIGGTGEPRGAANRAKFRPVDKPNSAPVDACGKRTAPLQFKGFLNNGALRLTDIREGPPT
jgi:hypothetical protein